MGSIYAQPVEHCAGLCSIVLAIAALFTPRDWLWLRESFGVKSAQERVEVGSNAQIGATLFRRRLPLSCRLSHAEGLSQQSLGVRRAQNLLRQVQNAHNRQKVLPVAVLTSPTSFLPPLLHNHTEGPAAGVPRCEKSAEPIETGSICAKSAQYSSSTCAALLTPRDVSVPQCAKCAEPVETGSEGAQPADLCAACSLLPWEHRGTAESVPRSAKSAEPVKAGSKCANSVKGCAGCCWHNCTAYSRQGTLTGCPLVWKCARWLTVMAVCAKTDEYCTGCYVSTDSIATV
jgi:hypothetical protein